MSCTGVFNSHHMGLCSTHERLLSTHKCIKLSVKKIRACLFQQDKKKIQNKRHLDIIIFVHEFICDTFGLIQYTHNI